VSRTLSAAARNAIFASQTAEAFLVLLTLDHPTWGAPVRVTSDAVDTASRGYTYKPFPFLVSLPEERDDALARVRLTIDNVDRSIIAALRPLTSPPTVTLEVVLASSPDTLEAGPFDFTLRNVEYDALTITGDLMFEDVLNEPFPAGSFTPASYPGLF